MAIGLDRDQFARDGFTIVPDVLSSDEIERYGLIFEERLPPDKQPPGIPGNSQNGRKTLISDHTDPVLSNLVGHPKLIAAVEELAGSHFLVQSTSAPVITYKSPAGHERFDLGYHVDWPHNPPEPQDWSARAATAWWRRSSPNPNCASGCSTRTSTTFPASPSRWKCA